MRHEQKFKSENLEPAPLVAPEKDPPKMSTDEALALTRSGTIYLDESDYGELRLELIESILSRGAKSRDMRLPRSTRDSYQLKIERLHRLYLKLGGTFSIKELLA